MKIKVMIIFALAIVTSLMLGAHKTKEEPKVYSDIRKATHIFVDSRNWQWRGLPGAGDYTKNNFTVMELCRENGDVLEVFAKYYLRDNVGAEGIRFKGLGFRKEATSYYEGLDLWKKPE